MAKIDDDGNRWLNFDDILFTKVNGITQCHGIGGLNHVETKRAIEQLHQFVCSGVLPQEPGPLRQRQIHPDCKRVLQLIDALDVDDKWIRKYAMLAFTLHTDEAHERVLLECLQRSEGIQSFFAALEREKCLELNKDEISQLIICLVDPGCGMQQGFWCMECGTELAQREDAATGTYCIVTVALGVCWGRDFIPRTSYSLDSMSPHLVFWSRSVVPCLTTIAGSVCMVHTNKLLCTLEQSRLDAETKLSKLSQALESINQAEKALLPL